MSRSLLTVGVSHRPRYKSGRRGLLEATRIVVLGKVTRRIGADIEDVFDVDDYLKLFQRRDCLRALVHPIWDRDGSRCCEDKSRLWGIQSQRPGELASRNRATITSGFGATTLSGLKLSLMP